jgi:hypothetical protein
MLSGCDNYAQVEAKKVKCGLKVSSYSVRACKNGLNNFIQLKNAATLQMKQYPAMTLKLLWGQLWE